MRFLINTIFIFIFMFAFVHKSKAQCMTVSTIPEFNCATSALELTLTINNAAVAPPYTITSSPAGINTVISVSSVTLLNIPYQPSYIIFVATTGTCIGVGGVNYSNPTTPSNISLTNTMVNCFGGNTGASTAVYPAGTAPFTYTWSTGSNSSTVSGLIAGVYSVSITDSKSCTATQQFTITQAPEINSKFSTTLIACYGGTVNSVISSTGGVSPYSYTVSGTPISSGSISIANNLSAGIYTILTKDNNICLKTNTVLLTQANQQIISANIQQPSCPGVSDGSISVNVSGSFAGYTYTWQPVNSNTTSLSAVPAGNYTLSVKDASACITRSVFTVPQAPAIFPIVGVSKENCSASDGSYTLSLSGGHPPYTFTTNPGNSTLTIGTGLSSGNYVTIITDANSCKDTLNFFIGNLSTVSLTAIKVNSVECYNTCNGSVLCTIQNAVAPVTYSITGFPTTTLNLLSNLCAGTYVIKAIDAIGCPAIDTIHFATPPVFSYSAVPPPVMCIGKQATLIGHANGGTGSHTFIWNPGSLYGPTVTVNPSVTTVYNLNVYDSKNCTLAPYQVTVNVNPPISININSSTSGVCPGATAQITPTVSGGDENYRYNWMPGNSKGASIYVENLIVSTYSLYVNDACGSPEAFKEIKINLFPITQPSYQTKLTTACAPLCTEFVNMTPKSKNAIWNFGDKPFEKTGDSTFYCYDQAGNFNLKLSVTDSNSCKASATFTNAIHVLDKPDADYESIPGLITLSNSENVLFHNLSAKATSFSWYVNEVLIASSRDMYYSFPDTGNYDIKLVVENADQCSDYVLRSMKVFEGFSFYMPGTFTPNTDGLNDILIPKGIAWLTEGYVFEIFNKWGHKIFSTNEVHSGWDGGIQAPYFDPALSTANPNDVYAWRVQVTDNTNVKHDFTGYVTLLR